jgi:radical SAM-linked protein
MSAAAYARGWDHVKLYFMIGLPTERDDDILAIADLCDRTIAEGKKHNRKASVRTGVSTFVPKPFTPFQWAAQIPPEETERRQRLLMDRFRSMPQVKFGRHNPRETFLEGLVSRADRRAADLIEAAFRRGARFDAWSEHLDWEAWTAAIAETGYDTTDALRERALDERLPWDHLDIHVPKEWFVEDWQRAMVLQHAPDCRHSKCHRCGVIDVKRALCASMLRNAIEGRKEERTFARGAVPVRAVGGAVSRLRFRVGRTGPSRFLSHLEMASAWHRTLRRARIPVSYSEGFHPHPRVNYSTALPVGEESLAEYMDVVLTAAMPAAEALAALRRVLPAGFVALGAEEVPVHAPGTMGQVEAVDYALYTAVECAERIAELLARTEILVERESKRGKITLDLRPMIRSLRWSPGRIDVGFQTVEGRPGKAKELIALLGLEAARTRVVRLEVYFRQEGERRSVGLGEAVA